MSRATKTINSITGTVISVAVRIIIAALVLFVLLKGVKIAYNFGHSVFYAEAVDEKPGRDVVITVVEESDASETAELLKRKGLIDNEISFRIQKKFFEYDLKPGEYVLNTSMTSREMLEIMNEGPEEEE